jgi:hypothetical protein
MSSLEFLVKMIGGLISWIFSLGFIVVAIIAFCVSAMTGSSDMFWFIFGAIGLVGMFNMIGKDK